MLIKLYRYAVNFLSLKKKNVLEAVPTPNTLDIEDGTMHYMNYLGLNMNTSLPVCRILNFMIIISPKISKNDASFFSDSCGKYLK